MLLFDQATHVILSIPDHSGCCYAKGHILMLYSEEILLRLNSTRPLELALHHATRAGFHQYHKGRPSAKPQGPALLLQINGAGSSPDHWSQLFIVPQGQALLQPQGLALLHQTTGACSSPAAGTGSRPDYINQLFIITAFAL